MEEIEKYFSDFTETQLQQFAALQEVYADWNAKINVISRKDLNHFYLHHVLHSLAIAATFAFEKGQSVMDLGCGGGFPGVPLAIFFPETEFHLVDSIRKKLMVVSSVADSIGLHNITVQHARAEEIKNRKFDAVVSRAVAPMKDLWQWSKPLIRRNKSAAENSANGLVCLKGGDLSAEIQQSGCKPYIWEVEKIFPDPFFKEKYLLYQPL
jgi:16S rRNA (guanine527-N7)-methyltransferase